MTNMSSDPQPETPDQATLDWQAHDRIVQQLGAFIDTIPAKHRGAPAVERALGLIGTDRPIPPELESELNDLRVDVLAEKEGDA